MQVLQYISELLLRNDCVIVPGFGGFIANHVPAKIHPVVNSFSPPAKEIIFNASLKHNDGLLANHIAQRENIPYNQAIEKIVAFVEESQAALLNDKKVFVEKVGVILLDDYNNYQFESDGNVNYLLSSYGLTEFVSPAIRREGIEQRIERALVEKKVFRSERKAKNTFAKIAIISVPAAAIFVWGFFHIGLIEDVSTNYSTVLDVFSTKPAKETATKITAPEKEFDASYTWQTPYDSLGSLATKLDTTAYPIFVEEATTAEVATTKEETTAPPTPNISGCKFYIIGSCNKNKDLAENYKSKLIAKGFTNANIIEPAEGGLYKVFIDCFDSEESARSGLSSVQQNENPNAWLLKM